MSKEGRKFLFTILFLVVLIIPFAAADLSENSSLVISVNISEPVASVEIFPNSIDLGEITKGYATAYENISITNTGNLDIIIQPILENGSHQIFQSLKFSTGACSTWHNMSYYSNKTLLSIDRPILYEGERQSSSCIKLDLINYKEDVPSFLILSTNLTFYVMADE